MSLITFEHRLNFCVGSVRFCLLAPIEMFAKPFTCWWKPTLCFLAKYVKSLFCWQHLIISLVKYQYHVHHGQNMVHVVCHPAFIQNPYVGHYIYIHIQYIIRINSLLAGCDRCECIIQFPTLAHASAGLPTHLNQEKYPYHVRWCWQLLARGYPVNKLKTSTINQIGTKPDIKPINRGTLWWLNWTNTGTSHVVFP